MKIAFLSSTTGNKGPSNVHCELVAHWPAGDSLSFPSQSPKLFKIFDSIRKGIKADVVFSGDADWPELVSCRVLCALGKPIVCFNHGYVPYENEINHLGLSQMKMDAYRKYLSESYAVVANSKLQMEFVAREQPDLVGKLSYVNNAVDPFEQLKHYPSESSIIRVAVSGGTRPIKGNEAVARAIKLLNQEGHRATLQIFGRDYADNPELSELLELPYIQMKGQVSHSQFVKELQDIDVFVMNSVHEPFGLSALDAISAGASLLLSRHCGVQGIMSLTGKDIINDVSCSHEIAEAIVYLRNNPNSKRLYQSIDFSKLNWSSTSMGLRDIMANCICE
ncbi:MAG TPA: glycosyltransferase [Collinsella ihuae]|uniref:Glycosyltransferase n=1 Tax=Collinsella ihumii TaxID=1720204 RepID=A0A921IQP2_9ACTN|nr:glycosyltransferase [Collinsella ihumii]